MPRRVRRAKPAGLEDINLVPIMSILVILIPMLIFAFTFFEVTVQSVAAPKMGARSSKPKQEQERKPLNLTVVIRDDSFLLKYQDEDQDDPETTIQRREFGPDSSRTEPYWDYDYAELYNRLADIKTRFPDEQQINIGAEMHIPWQTIARTIDAARLELEGGPFEGEESMAEFREAEVKTIKEEPQLLFPNVVFVVAE